MTEHDQGTNPMGVEPKVSGPVELREGLDARAGWADRQFVLLAVLGAFGTIFHQAQWWTFVQTPPQLLAMVGALLILMRPTSIWRWAFMHAAVIWEVLWIMPHASNHIFFHMVLSGAMIVAIGAAYVRGGFKPMTRGQVFRAAAPMGRVLIIVLYFFTWFHKFNWAFFDPELSCGVEFYHLLRDKAWFLPDYQEWMGYPNIFGVMAMEMALMFTLLFKPLRKWGIFIVLFFHGLVGAINHPNFSAIAYGYIVLFLPEEATDTLVARYRAFTEKRFKIDWSVTGPKLLKLLKPVGLVGSVAVVAWGVYVLAVVIPARPAEVSLLREPWAALTEVRAQHEADGTWSLQVTVQKNLKRIFMLYGPVVFWGVYFVALWKCGWTWPRPYFKLQQRWLYVFPVLLVLNCLNPYFGGKTDSAISMFSNLITEPGLENHVLLSWTPQFTDYQKQRVTILESSDADLQELAERQYALHWFELRRYVQHKAAIGEGDFSVRYLRGEFMVGIEELDRKQPDVEEVVVADAGQDEALMQEPVPWLMHKTMYLRPLRYGEKNSCDH